MGRGGRACEHGQVGSSSVPRALHLAAAWAWRGLVVAAAAYAAVRAAAELRLVVLPTLLALFLLTVLWPAAALGTGCPPRRRRCWSSAASSPPSPRWSR